MPFLMLFIGVLLVVTGFQNTYSDFGKLIKGDFTGAGNFIYWVFSIVIVGVIGYIPRLEPFAKVFIALIIISMFLTKNRSGFFNQLSQALSSGTQPSSGSVQTNATGGDNPSDSSPFNTGTMTNLNPFSSLGNIGGMSDIMNNFPGAASSMMPGF